MNSGCPRVCCEQRPAEFGAEPIRLGVHQAVHESLVALFGKCDGRFTEPPHQFVYRRFERMAVARLDVYEIRGAIDPDHEHAMAGHLAGQLEEQADRRRVGPLQVVEDEQDRVLAGDRLEKIDGLADEIVAGDRCRRSRAVSARDELLEAGQPPAIATAGGRGDASASQQAGDRNQRAEDIRRDVGEDLDQSRNQSPEPFGLFDVENSGSKRGLDVAGDERQHLPEGGIGIVAPAASALCRGR